MVWGLCGTALRLGAAALVFIVWIQGRKRIRSEKARQHFLFMTALVFGLLLMPVVWEHYLAVLFIPVAYLLANLAQLSRVQERLLLLICLFCGTQNLILILWLNAHMDATVLWVSILAGLLKSAPLILFTLLVWRYRESWIATSVRVAEVTGDPPLTVQSRSSETISRA
jgi:phosphoglycerol transferase MdoB-like AlkP superfamily enzyme